MQATINGIQQVGIGVANAGEAFEWYKKHFGFNAIVFEDTASARLMTRYTGNTVHQRYAVLAMNMQGGGGFEIWQYTSRTPQAPQVPLQLGHLGVYAVKLRCKDVPATYEHFKKLGVQLLTEVSTGPKGKKNFFVQDPYNNVFQVVENDYWFTQNKNVTGGVCGAVIGVHNMQAALRFYQQVLQYKLVYEGEEEYEDLKKLPGGNAVVQRAVLKHEPLFCSAFSKLLGPTVIELVCNKTLAPQKIFDGRYWGDLGFIHICYDVCGMQAHSQQWASAGFPLTVNSADSFDMGKASGHFGYNEDPDGTLIEYVETHKVPILKKLNWYLDLRKRKQQKPLPNWMVRCMGLGKKTLQSN